MFIIFRRRQLRHNAVDADAPFGARRHDMPPGLWRRIKSDQTADWRQEKDSGRRMHNQIKKRRQTVHALHGKVHFISTITIRNACSAQKF